MKVPFSTCQIPHLARMLYVYIFMHRTRLLYEARADCLLWHMARLGALPQLRFPGSLYAYRRLNPYALFAPQRL